MTQANLRSFPWLMFDRATLHAVSTLLAVSLPQPYPHRSPLTACRPEQRLI